MMYKCLKHHFATVWRLAFEKLIVDTNLLCFVVSLLNCLVEVQVERDEIMFHNMYFSSRLYLNKWNC
jgi:hypothetical protein